MEGSLVVRAGRYAYMLLAWAFVAGIVLQVFFIGLGLFVGPENLVLHTTFGWLLHLGPLPVLVAAAFAQTGRRQILLTVALTVLIFFVPILAALRSSLPLAAAFHPVGALLAFWLAIVVARGATKLAGSTDVETRTTRGEWMLVVVLVALVLFLSFSGSPEPV